MNIEYIGLSEDFSDTELAEIFRVLIIPIVDDSRVSGVITREDFIRALAQRVLDASNSCR